jgi:hypothetical protein
VPHFVKVVLVKLSDKTRKVAVFKVLGQNVLRELLVLSIALVPCIWQAHGCRDVPLVPQNCRRRFPIELRFHRLGSPAS